MTETFTIRQMQESEVEETYLLIDKEGWNLTLDKFTHLFRSRPEAFTVAVTPSGEVVGTVSFFPTFPNEYVLGNIVIKGPYRHKGMGYKLVEAMMAQRPNCVVSCTAVPGADQFYLNVGFKFTEPQQGHDIFHILLDTHDINQRCQQQDTTTTVQDFDPASFHDLVTYDREVKGYESREYVSMMVDCFKTWVARDGRGSLVGFAAAFIKRDEIVLDSLCADSPEVACLFI
ncbi:uncharacterized protein LOC131931772, partial [Physella acuta]|uniref:uncharacterized protein LOC131931772 n=1 Tax=Physella acuta TaxID=109671 RepID=UPI0027DD09C7